ncbi:MAG: DUF6279 family lipoprotein [Gammaproteobacteria bacterium]
MSKLPLTSITLLLVISVVGCSMVATGYNNADWYLRYKINNYTSFNTTQKETIQREVGVFMNWHRRDMLPEYIKFLKKIDQSLQNSRIEKEQIFILSDELRGLYRITLRPTIHPAAHILANMSKPQIQELEENLKEENEKLKEESLNGSRDDQLSRRAEKTIDFIEDFTGNLSGEQKEKITRMSRQLPFAAPAFMQNREKNQRKIIELIHNNEGAEKIASFIGLWISTPEHTRTPDEQKLIKEFQDATNGMIANIYTTLTPQQKQRLRDKIQEYTADLGALTRKSQVAADWTAPSLALFHMNPIDLSGSFATNNSAF